MITEIHYPETLAPEKLDEYLSRGWFRMGSMIFTCHFLCFESGLYSAVWTRVPLQDYSFRKSLRKLLKKNGKQFTVQVRKAQFSEEKEALYQLHKTRFEGYIAPTLNDSLFGNTAIKNLYNTWEASIYDGEQLIGASFFDLGSDSVASIMGLYDPSYEKHSLGFYSMLLEIEFAKSKNMQYYYPGYVVPGYKRFDYKLRVGTTEYYNPRSKDWEPWETINHEKMPAELLTGRLKAIEERLIDEEVWFHRYIYQLYDKKLFGFDDMDYFRSPVFLKIAVYPENRNKWIVLEYDFLSNEFRLTQVAKFNDPLMFIYDLFKDANPEKNLLDFLFIESAIFATKDIQEMVVEIKKQVAKLID